MDSAINPYQSPEPAPPVEEITAGEHASSFQSARPWGIAACLGIGANLLVAMAAMWISIALLLLYNVDDVAEIDPEMEQSLLFWLNMSFVAMIAVRLLTAIPFMVWMYKVYLNLLALGHASVDWKPWLAPICWLIPVFNLFAPCLIMREILWKSDPQAEVLGKNHPALQMVNIWWAAWIGALFMSWIGNRLDFAAQSLPDFVFATRWDVGTSVVLIVCGVLAIWLIIDIDGRQLRRSARQLPDGIQFVQS